MVTQEWICDDCKVRYAIEAEAMACETKHRLSSLLESLKSKHGELVVLIAEGVFSWEAEHRHANDHEWFAGVAKRVAEVLGARVANAALSRVKLGAGHDPSHVH